MVNFVNTTYDVAFCHVFFEKINFYEITALVLPLNYASAGELTKPQELQTQGAIMRIDINIANAIDRLLNERHIAAAALAKELKISEAALVKWRRPGNGITGRMWQALYPKIKQYLPQERIFIAQNGEEHYSSLNETSKSGNPYFEPKFIPQMVPIFAEADLLAYLPMVQSVEQYACIHNLQRTEYRPRIAGCGGIFAHDLQSPASGMPVGARLFISSEAKPKSGCMALAIDMQGKLHIGLYTADNGLFSIGGISGKLVQASTMITMICPVIMYEVITYKP